MSRTLSLPLPAALLLVLCLLGVNPAQAREPQAAAATATERTWRAVLFDGRKVGHGLNEREVLADGSVRTAELMELEIQRDGISVSMSSLEETIESADGQAQSFRAEVRTAGQRMHYRGQRNARGEFVVDIESAGSRRQQTLKLPPQALFFEGQRKALAAALTSGEDLVAIDAFVPSQLQTVPLETSIKPRRRVELMHDEAELFEVEQLVRYPDGPIQVQAFVDETFNAQRIRMNLLGMQIELLACDETCARAPNQSLDFLDRLVLESPRPFSTAELDQPMRIVLQVDGSDAAPTAGAHQRVRALGDGRFELLIDPGAALAADGDSIDPLYREPSAWVQSDSVLIQDLAKRAMAGADTAPKQMQAAEEFVRKYIFGKTLSVGYASALEVATTRQGDCTEHALLLAALARAQGIPARVATGLAYVPSFGQREAVFVPHAWTEAYVDGRWQGYDAALRGFGSGHIALAVGDGDPVRYFAGVALLGRLSIASIEPVAAP